MNIDTSVFESLEEAQRQMDRCRLCLENGHAMTPRAIYSGSSAARMMVLGQAPGVTEVAAGRPFNAGSGTRLFQWLAQAGIAEDWFRQTQYMTSVTKCFPGKAGLGKAGAGGGDRVPSRSEQRLCRPFLEAELRLVNPQVILPVGRLAIEVFYPDKPPLEQIIGAEKQQDGRWIIPLPHPSGASRWHQSAENRQRIEEAMRLIAGHVQRLFG